MDWYEPRFSVGRTEDEIGKPGSWTTYDHLHRCYFTKTDQVLQLNMFDKLCRLILARGCELFIRAPIGDSFRMELKWTEFIPPGVRVPMTVSGVDLEDCLRQLIEKRSELEWKYRQGKRPEEVRQDEADSPQAGEADPQEAEATEVESEPGSQGGIPGAVSQVSTQGDLFPTGRAL